MKVLLAYRAPDEVSDDPEAATLPAGLRWMAARLRADGHDASVANFTRLSWKQVETFFAGSAPRVVGVSCLTFNRQAAMRLARVARRASPDCTVILGGPHASALPALMLARVREADAVATGEGEETLSAACRRIERGEALAGAGLVVRGAEAQPVRLPVLDDLPLPVGDLEGAGLVAERDLRHVVASRPRPGGPERRMASSVAREIAQMREQFGVIEASMTGPGLVHAPWLHEVAAALRGGPHPCAWDMPAHPAELAGPRDEDLETALHDAAASGLRAVDIVLSDDEAAAIPRGVFAEASRVLRRAGVVARLTLRIGTTDRGLGARWLADMRVAVRALRPASGRVQARELLPGSPEWDAARATEDLDDAFWFDEDRHVVPLASEAALERASGALDSVLREVAREARPGHRDLELLSARGPSAWTEIAWGDFRLANDDAPEAERRYRLAAEMEPGSPFPWLRLAAVFRRARGGSDREQAALRQVIQRVPRHAFAKQRLLELRQEAEKARRG